MSQTADAKAYYGYLFGSNKQPTKVLDALLRGLANYIVEFVGNKEDKTLSPAKLASFYKAVGGNYDSLFVDVPYPSISWIYASIGCQHTLLPTKDDYMPPSIPALTTKGFVRWQSIELLLGPEEHVPFIQNAVRNFAIKNPDNGESFPVDLPKEAFPLQPDVEIERWHNQCAEKLRQRAASGDESDGPPPPLPPRPKVQAGYVHVRRPTQSPQDSPRARPTSVPPSYLDANTRQGRPSISYQHVAPVRTTVRPNPNRSPSHRSRRDPPTPEEIPSPRLPRSRRRSFPENRSPSPEEQGVTLHPPVEHHSGRRHSQPRLVVQRGSSADDDLSDTSISSDEGKPASPAGLVTKRYPRPEAGRSPSHEGRTISGVRYVPKSTPPTPTSPIVIERQREREIEDVKRRSYPITIDLNGKLSAPFLMKPERRRIPRSNSKGGVRWKDLSEVTEIWRKDKAAERNQSEEDRSSPRRSDVLERDLEETRFDRKRREREPELLAARPRGKHRTSSHDRDRYLGWSRDRDRDRDRESDRDARALEGRGKDRRGGGLSSVRGVDGRKYPAGLPEGYR